MIISKLTLHNFGVYAGTNTFTFSNSKPVVLIGGMNGRGKTTFLNAVLLSLYGSNSFAYKESSYKSYGQYLKSIVNNTDGSGSCYVDIVFKINPDDNDIYYVHREWSSAAKRIKDKLVVKKNGETDDFLSNNWPIFIENLLPSALAPYFFFDGDNIAELAVGSTEEKMKEAIKALLGITVLDQLENDIHRINNKTIKAKDDRALNELLSSTQKKLEESRKELESIDEVIEDTTKKKEQIIRKLEEKNADYVAKGGLLVNQRQELYQRRSEKRVSLQNLNQQKIDIAASELPLILVNDLLKNINDKAKQNKDSRELSIVAGKVTDIYKEYGGQKNKELEAFLQYINDLSANKKADDGIEIGENALFQLNRLIDNDLSIRYKNAKELIDKAKKISEEIDVIDEHLSVDVDEKEINAAFKKIKQLEQQDIENNEKLLRLQRQRSEINGNYQRLASEYKKKVEASLYELELDDEKDRMLKYSTHALNVLQLFKEKLQERKIQLLSETITDCFRKIANKQNLIERIEMDPVSLDFYYIDKNGCEVPKQSLSEGEKQMMIISILWSLAICSKRKLPVIIDTPLARLDSEHRKSLIKTYFPNAGEQTIILSTDSEIGGEYYSILKEHISDEYTLIYDDNKKSTHISTGYFGEMK